LIATLFLIAVLSGCGGGDSNTGAGQGSLISAEATDNSVINLTIEGDIDNIDADAQDEAVINIDNGTAEAQFAIPVEEGITGGSTLDTVNCPAGSEFVNDNRGPGCSDGNGGFTPIDTGE